MLFDWPFFVAVYIVGNVLFQQTYKHMLSKSNHDGAVTAAFHLPAAAAMFLFVPFFPWQWSSDWKVYLLALIPVVLLTIGIRIETITRKHLPVSEIVILNRVRNIIFVIAGIVLLKEPLALNVIIGALMIFFANLLIVRKAGKFVINKYIGYVLLVSLFVVAATLIDANISQKFNIPFFLGVAMLLRMILILMFERISLKQFSIEFKQPTLKPVLILGFAMSIAVIGVIRGFQLGEVSVVAPLNGTAALFSAVVAMIIFKAERIHIPKKILAGFLTVFAVYLINS